MNKYFVENGIVIRLDKAIRSLKESENPYSKDIKVILTGYNIKSLKFIDALEHLGLTYEDLVLPDYKDYYNDMLSS